MVENCFNCKYKPDWDAHCFVKWNALTGILLRGNCKCKPNVTLPLSHKIHNCYITCIFSITTKKIYRTSLKLMRYNEIIKNNCDCWKFKKYNPSNSDIKVHKNNRQCMSPYFGRGKK